MSEKKVLSKEAGIIAMTHLNIFAEKVGKVVADYHSFNDANENEQLRTVFASACMNDVAILSEHLITLLEYALKLDDQQSDKTDVVVSEADVVDLNEYKARGGLLN
jgi:hypothetical protein